MGRQTKSNVPVAALRWSIERAGIEFGMTSATLRKSLAKESIVCGSDGCFSTKDVCRAVFGGLSEEKLLTQRELTRKYSLENAITEGNLLDRTALARTFAVIADAISSRIMSSELSRSAKQNILRDLSAWPLALEEVADRQTKLPRRGNGQAPEDSQSEH